MTFILGDKSGIPGVSLHPDPRLEGSPVELLTFLQYDLTGSWCQSGLITTGTTDWFMVPGGSYHHWYHWLVPGAKCSHAVMRHASCAASATVYNLRYVYHYIFWAPAAGKISWIRYPGWGKCLLVATLANLRLKHLNRTATGNVVGCGTQRLSFTTKKKSL